MDSVDQKILSILQREAKTTNADLARQVGMAPSAVLERVRKLEERGLIKGYHATLNLPALGYGLVAFVFVKTNEGWTSRETGIKLADIPHVLECHDVAGEDCYLLKVRAKDPLHLNNVLRQHLAALPQVLSTRTTIVFDTFKEKADFPIEEVGNDL